jgi:hypothetical protein
MNDSQGGQVEQRIASSRRVLSLPAAQIDIDTAKSLDPALWR